MYIVLLVVLGLLFMAGIVLNRYSAVFTWFRYKYTVERLEGVTYIEGSTHPKHRLDIYLPKKTKNFPVVVFIHGGYWNSGDKNYRRHLTGLYSSIGASLASRGIGAVVSSYRLLPKVRLEEQIADIAASISWTAENASSWGGNGQLFVAGHSSGAHIICLLASNLKFYNKNKLNQDINGYIALSPILDVKSLAASHDEIFNRSVTYKVFGRNKRDWQEYSPLHHFLNNPKASSRLLFVAGEKDFPYIIKSSSDSHKKMTNAGVNVTLSVIPDYNHTDMVVRFGRKNDPIIKLVVDFIGKKQ